MKSFTINNQRYTVKVTGYGQYSVSNGEVSLHTTDSHAYDAIDDDEDMDYDYAVQHYLSLFENYYAI